MNQFCKLAKKAREMIYKNPRKCEVCGYTETIHNVVLKYDNGKMMCEDCSMAFYDKEDCENNPQYKTTEVKKMNRQEQKQEAIERMKLLKFNQNIIKEFEKDDIVNLSEHGGFLYWLTDEQKSFVEDFEAEYKVVVYHVIHDYTEFGELLTFFYVSEHIDEWGYDRDDLQNGYACAYVKNLDDNDCSEFGSICFKRNSADW